LEEAVRLCEEARKCFKESSPDYGGALVNEGVARFRLAEHGVNATANLEEAVRLYEGARECFDKGSPDYGSALMNEGVARQTLAEHGVNATANLEEAVRLYQRASDVAESCGHWNIVVGTRVNCARLLHKLGRREDAYNDYAHALRAVETMRRLIPRSAERRRKLLEEYSSLYREMVNLCLELDRYEEAWHWAERSKLRTLLDLLGSARPRLDTDEKKKAYEEWQEALKELNDIELRILGEWDGDGHQRYGFSVSGFRVQEQSEEKWRENVGRLLAAQEKERQLRQRFTDLLEEGRDLVQVEVPEPSDLARHLMELAGMSYEGTKRSERRPLLVEFFLLGNDRYCVFLLPLWEVGNTSSKLPLRVEAVSLPKGEIEVVLLTFSMAIRLIKELAEGRDRSGKVEEAPIEEEALREEERWQRWQDALRMFDSLPQLMGDAFFAPWSEALRKLEPTELILVANGFLHQLPLHVAQVNGEKLIERYPLVYMPSVTLCKDLLRKRGAKVERFLPALVMGPPNKDLPMADYEAKDAARHFGVRPYQFEEMRIAVLQEHAGKVGWVHLSTHSGFDRGDFLRSWVLFHDEMLRLSQLFSDEGLDMGNLELWYEGSCESAGSEPGLTDELMGFVRALIYAGARSVMATLWPVEDESACFFGQRFYFHLKEGKRKVEAYREAVRELLNNSKFSNPYFSAPFVLFGDALME
jgi:CHAT domain-containing protein